MLLQERIRVAAAHGLRADLTASNLGPFRLEPREEPVRIFLPDRPTTPRFTQPGHLRRYVSSQENHLQWLRPHLPTVEQVSEEWTRNLGVEGASYRTFDAARAVASDLHRRGLSRPEISRYLDVFGYQNSKGYVGVWPENRLKEVVAVTR